MTGLDRQLKLLGAYGFFTYPFACIPFLFFYFKEHGVDLHQYMWLIASYYWAMVLMEIPTGIFADRFGRRSSMIGGSITLFLGFATIYLGSSITAFVVAEIMLGVGHSLLSGAPTAMLFDSLRDEDRGSQFLVSESRIHAMRLIGTGGSFLLGGALASLYGIGPTIVLTGGLCLTGAVIACLIRESPRPSRPLDGVRPPLLRAALRDLRSPPLLWILGYFVLLFGLLRFAFHTYQPYFEETVFDHEHPERNWLTLGILFAALNFVAAPCSRLAPALTRRFRYRVLFPWLPASLGVAFLLMAVLPNWFGVLLFFVHQVPFGIHWAVVQEFVNQRVGTVSRATALSILSFVGRVSFAAWIPIIGAYEDRVGTPDTYFVVGAIGLGLTFLWCTPGLGARLLQRAEPGTRGDRPE